MHRLNSLSQRRVVDDRVNVFQHEVVLLQQLSDLLRLVNDRVATVVIGVDNALQDLIESRQASLGGRRPIGPTKKELLIRCEKRT